MQLADRILVLNFGQALVKARLPSHCRPRGQEHIWALDA